MLKNVHQKDEIASPTEHDNMLAFNSNSKCVFCGNSLHPRAKCPARNVDCYRCSKKGHFSKVCRSSGRFQNHNKANSVSALLATVSKTQNSAESPNFFNKIHIKGHVLEALIDTGSTSCFISKETAGTIGLIVHPSSNIITMAANSTCTTIGYCIVDLQLDGKLYTKVMLNVLPKLCTQIILGRDFMSRHSSIEFQFPGSLPKLSFCSVAEMKIDPLSLFSNLSSECKPIRIPSRRFSSEDQRFIKEQVSKLLSDGIIEKSSSPWRAQVLVAGGGIHKKRMVVDYSQTVNKFTYLDAYPSPNINDLVHGLAKNKYFSKLDLKSAYYQVPLLLHE